VVAGYQSCIGHQDARNTKERKKNAVEKSLLGWLLQERQLARMQKRKLLEEEERKGERDEGSVRQLITGI